MTQKALFNQEFVNKCIGKQVFWLNIPAISPLANPYPMD